MVQLGWYTDLRDEVILDVGSGRGYFSEALEAAGAHYIALDNDESEVQLVGTHESERPRGVVGNALALPFTDASIDIAFSSNAIEHVEKPWSMADEMARVTKPGGLVFISYTLWYGWWGGHETSPWHYLGGARAARRYRRKHGSDPKNYYGRTMFKVTARDGIRWARTSPQLRDVEITARYHPWWAAWMARVPILREVLTWNLLIVGRRV